MEEYLDAKNSRLEKGFYLGEASGKVYYFNENYNQEGKPIFQEFEDKIPTTFSSCKRLRRLDKKSIEYKVQELRKQIDWFESRLPTEN